MESINSTICGTLMEYYINHLYYEANMTFVASSKNPEVTLIKCYISEFINFIEKLKKYSECVELIKMMIKYHNKYNYALDPNEFAIKITKFFVNDEFINKIDKKHRNEYISNLLHGSIISINTHVANKLGNNEFTKMLVSENREKNIPKIKEQIKEIICMVQQQTHQKCLESQTNIPILDDKTITKAHSLIRHQQKRIDELEKSNEELEAKCRELERKNSDLLKQLKENTINYERDRNIISQQEPTPQKISVFENNEVDEVSSVASSLSDELSIEKDKKTLKRSFFKRKK